VIADHGSWPDYPGMHETLSRPPILGSAWPVLWYATAAHHPYDADDHRAGASWYNLTCDTFGGPGGWRIADLGFRGWS
jgi:hypothetical protein